MEGGRWSQNKHDARAVGGGIVLPTCASLDAIFLTDRVAGAINQVNTEKMARKIMGIKTGFKEVMLATIGPGDAVGELAVIGEDSSDRLRTVRRGRFPVTALHGDVYQALTSSQH